MKPFLFILIFLTSFSAYSRTCVCAEGPVVREAEKIELCQEVAQREWWEDMKDRDCDADELQNKLCDYAKQKKEEAYARCEKFYTGATSQLILIVEGTKVPLATFESRALCNDARKDSYKEDCD